MSSYRKEIEKHIVLIDHRINHLTERCHALEQENKRLKDQMQLLLKRVFTECNDFILNLQSTITTTTGLSSNNPL